MPGAALVTGGSSGIGLAIARMLREEDFELTLVSRRPERIEAAAADLGAAAIAADVSEAEECERIVAEHRDRFGRLDVLVNSAGIGIGGGPEGPPGEDHPLPPPPHPPGGVPLSPAGGPPPPRAAGGGG